MKKLQTITDDLRTHLPDELIKPVVVEIGEVVYVGDGICKISGLPSARMEDMVQIETTSGTLVPALILGITPDQIQAVVMGDYTKISQGNIVRSGGELLQIPAGESVLGRVIDPLGNPLDGGAPLKSRIRQPIERLAPGVAKRQPVVNQLETGILVVDTIVPLGQGQRELVIGDRKSGKSRLMTSMIMNQKGKGIYCVYVAIGAQKAKVKSIEQMLRAHGAMEYTCIVVASSDDPPSLNYIAPYAGTALAEYFAYNGKDAVIVYDDLSKHAKSYRQMSLLLKRSPGRDAYPGDIFYLHSRLLERSMRLHESLGGGSLTGFPIAETQNGDVSEYICTNLMSITDGHIYLDVNMMHEGILPAVNSGTSVSRIGGGIQVPCLRKLGELASSQLARYNEVKSFETLNTEISEETELEIKRGKRVFEVFSQDAYERLLNDEKILLMYLVIYGKTDNLEIVDLREIKIELMEFYRAGKDKEFKEYQRKSIEEKDVTVLESEIMAILTEYVKFSKNKNAHLLIDKAKKEEEALPIVPDPNDATHADLK